MTPMPTSSLSSPSVPLPRPALYLSPCLLVSLSPPLRRPRPFVFRLSSFVFRPAFSLIELLVVIGIIGTLTALTTPALRSLTKSSAQSQAANQVRAALSQARSLALAQHRLAGVVFFQETSRYSLPVHKDQTALQFFVEDFNQNQYAHDPANTIFLASSPARDYLPPGITLAVLNDNPTRGVTTGDEASASLGRTRAILFDAQGRMITRHGLARPDLSGAPGTYPYALGDWLFTTKRGDPSVGISSPGIFLYDTQEYQAQNIPTGHAGDAPRNSWIKSHATALLINAHTGALLP